MSVTGIQNEINRIKQNIENAYSVYEAFGADIPAEQTSDNLVPTAGTMKPVLYSPQTLTEAQKEQVRNNIGASRTTVLGDNPTGGVANDTVDTWSNLGNGVAWISEQNQVIDQPSQYGFIINYIHETDIFQIFHDQTNGETYFRSGDNIDNWFQNWRRVAITNGDDYINAAGVRASEMITVGDDNSAMVIYTNGIGDRNSKLWIDAYGEGYFTEVYARQKKLATEEYVNTAVEQLSNEKVDKEYVASEITKIGQLANYLNSVQCPEQLPANAENGSDFNLHTFADFGDGFHSYFDDLLARYPNYLMREHLGKDASETLNMYRYVLGKHYYSAWCRENYPRMYAWKNGNAIMYSESVSPRIGEKLYDTPYVQTSGVDVETVTVPAKAVIIRGYRYSKSGQSFSALASCATLVFPSNFESAADTHELVLTNGHFNGTYTGCYIGDTKTAFNREVTATTKANATVATAVGSSSANNGQKYGVIFLVWDGSNTFANTKLTIDGKNIDLIVSDNTADCSLVTHATTEEVETEGTGGETITAVSATNRSRTVNGLEFVRYENGDIEPTVYYTPAYNPYNNVLYADGTFFSKISSITDDVMLDKAGYTYKRYPFGDLKKDGTKPLHITIIANEHGGDSEAAIPAVVTARLIRDLCNGKISTDNPIYRYLRDNVQLTIIPVVNPHGLNKYASGKWDGYYNGNGVNINRNYDTVGWDYCYNNQDIDGNDKLGEYAGSENETQYVMNTIVDSKAAVAMSVHTISCNSTITTTQCMYQGQNPNGGYTQSKIVEIADDMKASYNLDFIPYNPLECPPETTAKSPSFITQCGAYGGIVEMQCHNPLATEDEKTTQTSMFTSVVMEQNYSLLLKFITMWLSDYLEAVGE